MNAFAMAKMWLAKCCATHEDCAIKKQRPPTRLVCVRNNTTTLVITDSMQEAPRYSTLSYCWGKTPFIKLSRDRLASFVEQIPWQELPPMFQDAIKATRQL